MSIVRDRGVAGDYRIQVVTGDDIIKTYLNNKAVKSCMGKVRVKNRLKFYTFCEGLKQLRIVKDDVVYLRSLLWTAKDIKTNDTIRMFDKVYVQQKYVNVVPYDPNNWQSWYAPKKLVRHESYEIFKDNFKKYADVRDTKRKLEVAVKPHKLARYPYMDTFIFLNEDKTKLLNFYDRTNPMYEIHDVDGFPEYLYPIRQQPSVTISTVLNTGTVAYF